MAGKVHFVSNYNDLSTNRGFQFEFVCDRCSAGYRTEFESTVTGTVSGVLRGQQHFRRHTRHGRRSR